LVRKYLPEWLDRDDHITIRHLLTHTTGIRDVFTMFGWAPLGDSTGDQNEAIAKILARQRGLNYAPGTQFQYNNGGYNLLGTIIKRATGQSLRTFTDANVFQTAWHDALLRPRRSDDAHSESGLRLFTGRRRLAFGKRIRGR
jgi:CubicO group peptidase (beta-lactamase class C family)